MSKFLLLFSLLFCLAFARSQNTAQDTIFLMNGHVVAEKVIDTLLGAVTILNPKKPERKINYELSQLYMVKFSDGNKRYYYTQDTFLLNYFTRDEMWMYMKGERVSSNWLHHWFWHFRNYWWYDRNFLGTLPSFWLHVIKWDYESQDTAFNSK